MRLTLLDFSQRPDLGRHARGIAEVQEVAAALGVRPLIVGAFARDLHLVHAHQVPVVRQTEDIDLALALDDWSAFEQLRTRLVASGRFASLACTDIKSGAGQYFTPRALIQAMVECFVDACPRRLFCPRIVNEAASVDTRV
jgi:hypothetical protein